MLMERGVSSTEYALLALLIALAIVSGLLVFGPGVAGLFDVDLTPGS